MIMCYSIFMTPYGNKPVIMILCPKLMNHTNPEKIRRYVGRRQSPLPPGGCIPIPSNTLSYHGLHMDMVEYILLLEGCCVTKLVRANSTWLYGSWNNSYDINAQLIIKKSPNHYCTTVLSLFEISSMAYTCIFMVSSWSVDGWYHMMLYVMTKIRWQRCGGTFIWHSDCHMLLHYQVLLANSVLWTLHLNDGCVRWWEPARSLLRIVPLP